MTTTSPTTPTSPNEHREHRTRVEAPAAAVFALLADLDAWPRVFPAFVHLEALDRTGGAGGTERVRAWTVSGTEVDSWVLRREVDPAARTITMRPEAPHPPLTELTRTLRVAEDDLGPDACTVVLEHDYRTADPGVATVIDAVATAELAALAEAAGVAHARPELVVTVEDTVRAAGDADDAFAFLRDAEQWPARLAHVAHTSVRPGPEGAALVETTTDEARGGTLTTSVARVCRPDRTVVFRHLVLPPVGRLHHVRWAVRPVDGGAELSAHQTVVVDPEGAAAMLGPDVDLTAVEDFVRGELSTKARLMLDGARAFAEERAAPVVPGK